MREREHPLKTREDQVGQVPEHVEVNTQKERAQYTSSNNGEPICKLCTREVEPTYKNGDISVVIFKRTQYKS